MKKGRKIRFGNILCMMDYTDELKSKYNDTMVVLTSNIEVSK